MNSMSFDRLVEVVGEDESNAGTPHRVLSAEVLQPAIMGTDASQASLIVLRFRRMSSDDAFTIERRHCIREHHLAHYPLAILVPVADAVIPVAHLLGAIMLLGRILVSATPFVECLAPYGIEILPILGVTAASMSVRGDQYVGLLSHLDLA